MDTYISIAAGVLLSISEILPFISKINSNGIFHFFMSRGGALLNNSPTTETDRLLRDETSIEVDNKNLTLHPPEMYELHYITKYIENEFPQHFLDMYLLSETTKDVLRSKSYVVEYDSVNDVHRIKW